MAIPLLVPLISLAISAIGAGVNAYQNSKADKLAEEEYNKNRRRLLTDMNTNPLDLVANKALLSQMDRRLGKQEEMIENKAAAGGATMENTLAAKQASNEVMADAVSGIMQSETAREDSIKNQLLNLSGQRTGQKISTKQASGQNWANMAYNTANSITNLGGTMIENGVPLKDLFKA